jgi:hypothetical protein
MIKVEFPISFKYYQYLLWYDNKFVGLTALKRLDHVYEYTYSLN